MMKFFLFRTTPLYVIQYCTCLLAVFILCLTSSPSKAQDQHAIPAQYYWYYGYAPSERGELKSSDSEAIQDGIGHVTSLDVSIPGSEWIVGPIRENPNRQNLSFINFEQKLPDSYNNVIIPSVTLQVIWHCPMDTTQIFIGDKYYCSCPTSSEIPINGQCVKPKSCQSQSDNMVGNPCNVATGQKIHQESLSLGKGFSVNLAYRSGENGSPFLSNGWTNGSDVSLSTSLINHHKIGVIRGGAVELLLRPGGRVFRARNDSSMSHLEVTSEGYTLHMKGGSVEYFNKVGNLKRRENSSGTGKTSTFDTGGRLLQQRNKYGHVANYFYNPNGRLDKVNNNQGIEYRFEYDLAGNLEFIILPDETADTWADNPKKQFHYENTEYMHHLTGITDENGVRYASYAYDSKGRAITTEHAQTTNDVGQEQFRLTY